MKSLFINLPNKEKVIRRYMCSYNSPNMLYPPLELMYLSSIIKQNFPYDHTLIIDAIAENLDMQDIILKIDNYKPDNIVFMTGFEIFSEDIELVKKIKTKANIICFGYLPSIFPKETLEKTNVNIILLNEPELSFLEVYQKIKKGKNFKGIDGIAYKKDGKIFVNKKRERIAKLDELPFPDYSFLKNKSVYHEPFLKRPFTIVQTSRGCPFDCNYCAHTFGKQVFYRSAKNVLDELSYLVKVHNIKSIKFIDDTFNIDKNRVKEICNGIIKKNLKLTWTCLSRADTLDYETLRLMKRAGCKSLHIGIESGSQKVLDFYDKGYQVEDIKNKLKLVNKAGIESLGFFIVGAPDETKEDLYESIKLAKEVNFDYIIVSTLAVYPGTVLFNKLKNNIDFSLFPYKCCIRTNNKNYLEYEKLFYKLFYFRISYLFRKFKKFLLNPIEVFKSSSTLIKYLITTKKQLRDDLF